MSEPVTELPKTWVNRVIKLMLIGLLLAVSYVILRGCESPKTDLDSYAVGEMSKLTILDEVEVQPQFSFRDAEGNDVSLADFRGDLLVVNIWATWCAPCLEEMPSLNALAADPPADNIRVVTISVDRGAQEALDYLDSLELRSLTFYHDPSFGIARGLNAPGLPITVIYSPSGRELARLTGGADWNSADARRLLEALSMR